MESRTVKIPAKQNHAGIHFIDITLDWVCPVCGEPRGEPQLVWSYDGSRRLLIHGWVNGCGHTDFYRACRKEARLNGLNKQAQKGEGNEMDWREEIRYENELRAELAEAKARIKELEAAQTGKEE